MENFCIICQRKILNLDNYYKILIHVLGEHKKTDYVHISCYQNDRNIHKELGEMVTGLRGKAEELGLLPKKEIIVTL